MISQEAQHEALDSFLGSQGFDAEYMALALLKTGLAYRGQRYFHATSRCKIGGEVIHWAAEKGYDLLMQYILENDSQDKHVLNDQGKNTMHIACWLGRVTIVKMLLDSGLVKFNTVSMTKDLTCLTEMVTSLLSIPPCQLSKNLVLLELLLAYQRVNTNMLSAGGEIALNLADEVATVECLLRNERIYPNAIDGDGDTAFHMAVLSDDVDIVACMLQSEHFDPNMINTDGYS
jgi:ankyrin repeat protein